MSARPASGSADLTAALGDVDLSVRLTGGLWGGSGGAAVEYRTRAFVFQRPRLIMTVTGAVRSHARWYLACGTFSLLCSSEPTHPLLRGHTYRHTHTHIRTSAHIHTQGQTHTLTPEPTHIHTHTHTCRHTRTHTLTNAHIDTHTDHDHKHSTPIQ